MAIKYTVKIDDDGTKLYYNDKDQLHREDGPAYEGADGTKEWWINGQPHREDGPAIEWFDGTKEWFINGKKHREDGPAYEDADGLKEWWINGEELTEEEFNNRNRPHVGKTIVLEGVTYTLS